MRAMLLTIALTSAFASAALAQGAIQSIPNGQNSGVAVPDPGRTYTSIPNGRDVGVADPAPPGSNRSIPNGQNSGVAVPVGPAVTAPPPVQR